MRVGITGYKGFIGSFFKNYLEHFTHHTPVIKEPLDNFSDVSVVVHFAEKNRGNEGEVYNSNRKSCKNLIESMKIRYDDEWKKINLINSSIKLNIQ